MKKLGDICIMPRASAPSPPRSSKSIAHSIFFRVSFSWFLRKSSNSIKRVQLIPTFRAIFRVVYIEEDRSQEGYLPHVITFLVASISLRRASKQSKHRRQPTQQMAVNSRLILTNAADGNSPGRWADGLFPMLIMCKCSSR